MPPRKPRNSFSLKDPDFTAKLEVMPPSVPDKVVPEVVRPEPPAKSPPVKAEKPAVFQRVEAPTPQEKIDTTEQRALARSKQRPASKANVRIKINFGWSDELVGRAAVWAEKARCPAKSILQKAFNNVRPDLVARLEKGLRYTEIPHDRAVNVAERLQSSITISDEAFQALQAEIDPENVTGVSMLISRWAREIATPMVERYLSNAGY